MAFWGVELKPGRPFILSVDMTRGRLHLSQATLGNGNAAGANKCLVQCNIGNKSPVYLCALFSERMESCQLNLEFEEVVQVSFSVIGPRSVHLTGYYTGCPRLSLNDDSESFGEDIAETDTEKSTDSNDEYESDDSFIDDDEQVVFPPSPVLSGGEPMNKKKLKSKPSRRRLTKKYRISDSDEQDTSKRNIFASKTTAIPASDSECEEWFTSDSLCKLMSSKQEAEVKAGMETSETCNRKIEDGINLKTVLKDDVAVAVAGEHERGTDFLTEVSLYSNKVGHENGIKTKEKRKRVKECKNHETYDCYQSNFVEVDKKRGVAKTGTINLPVRHELDQKQTNDIDADQFLRKKQSEKKFDKKITNEEDMDIEIAHLSTHDKKSSDLEIKNKNADAESSELKPLSMGLKIEELEKGKADGKIATKKKKVPTATALIPLLCVHG